GAGDKAFCVGADITAWMALEPLDMWRHWIIRGHRVFDRLYHLRQPVIALLNGYTFGGGLEFALAADIRLSADHAEFALPEVKLATVPGWGGTSRLPALIGSARAKQMIFSGERIDAKTAHQWGLINEIHPQETIHARALEIATQIVANAPIAVQLAKQAINTKLSNSSLEALAGALSATSEDAKEGLAAFQERRTPHFTGK
ncbi:MAG: enoyl-CoA hydratase-related protein, partial [Aggregatilineales bacterium]